VDKTITVQFFKLQPRNDAAPAFETALDTCWQLGDTPGARELSLTEAEADHSHVRLERLQTHAEWIEGEIVRVQRDNIPHEAHPEGLRPSRAQSQGHSAVFRYNPGLRLLVMEINPTNMTPSRFLRYIKRVDQTARYESLLIPNQDVWERYGRMRPRRFSVTLASVTNPEAVEGPVGAVLQSTRMLHEVTNGGTIHISVKPGGEPEGLNKNAIGSIIKSLVGNRDPNFEVTSLSVSADDEDDRGSQVLNFLDDILKEREEVDLNGLSSEESYERRIVVLRDCFALHMDYIVEHHG
jgi:hypothetical protein